MNSGNEMLLLHEKSTT